MNPDKICKEALNALCKSGDLQGMIDIPDQLKEHIKKCKQCSSYRNSLISTIALYRKYDIKLEKDVRKKLLCNTCEKLRTEI